MMADSDTTTTIQMRWWHRPHNNDDLAAHDPDPDNDEDQGYCISLIA